MKNNKMKFLYCLLLILPFNLLSQDANENSHFFDFTYDESNGKVTLDVQFVDKPFLYMNALAAGLGSNDIGLDRGKISSTKIVKFIKEGNKLLLIQPNQKFRAISKNTKEVNAEKSTKTVTIKVGAESISIDVQVICNTAKIDKGAEVVVLRNSAEPEEEDEEPARKRQRTAPKTGAKGKSRGKGVRK